MSTIHQKLLGQYRHKTLKPKKTVQSVVKQSFVKRINEEDTTSPLQSFLNNQKHIAAQAQPLDFRQLPRALKVYFPGPPIPPPTLKQIPYTYEMVPHVPYKVPKQRKGIIGKWVLNQSYFEQKSKSMLQIESQRIHQQRKDMTDKKVIFRKAVKKLVNVLRSNNMSLGQVIKNNGFNKKSYAYYDSQDFFKYVKQGNIQVERLLQQNPLLIFDVDVFKMTGLHWAARQNHPYFVKLFTQKYNANVSAKDMYGRTPFHLAVSKKNIECAIRIFVQGGKINTLDSQGRSVKDVAPDQYTKFLLNKLNEIRLLLKSNPLKTQNQTKNRLEQHIRMHLDQASLYF